MTSVTVEPFTADHLDDAAALLAARHRVHRLAEPALPEAFERPDVARAEVHALWEAAEASGAVAVRGGLVVGYLLGTPRPDATWGPNVWVEPAGHATQGPQILGDLYGLAAQRWVDEGRTAHYAVVPASDPALVDAWFHLGFGQQHVQGLRAAPALAASSLGSADDVGVRRATRADVPALATLDQVLPEHQSRAPVFSSGPTPTLAEATAEWEESVDDPDFATFVAEREGLVVGSAVGCAVEKSRMHAGLARPDAAALFAFAAVLPSARRQGIGRALGEVVLAWAAQAGYPTVVTDWRATNLTSSRAWPRLGFRETFLRLHRVVGY